MTDRSSRNSDRSTRQTSRSRVQTPEISSGGSDRVRSRQNSGNARSRQSSGNAGNESRGAERSSGNAGSNHSGGNARSSTSGGNARLGLLSVIPVGRARGHRLSNSEARTGGIMQGATRAPIVSSTPTQDRMDRRRESLDSINMTPVLNANAATGSRSEPATPAPTMPERMDTSMSMEEVAFRSIPDDYQDLRCPACFETEWITRAHIQCVQS